MSKSNLKYQISILRKKLSEAESDRDRLRHQLKAERRIRLFEPPIRLKHYEEMEELKWELTYKTKLLEEYQAFHSHFADRLVDLTEEWNKFQGRNRYDQRPEKGL